MHGGIRVNKLPDNVPSDEGDEIVCACFSEYVCHVQIDDIIMIEVCAIICGRGYGKIPEKIGRIAGPVIISTEHLRSKGLAESAGAAYAGKTPGRFNGLIDEFDQTAFIDVYVIPDTGKGTVARVQICSHIFCLR